MNSLPSPSRCSAAMVGLVCLAVVASCGGGGGGGGGGGTTPTTPSNLEQSLNQLGVNTTKTERESEPGMAIPADSYSPFGTSWEVSKTNELMVVGFGVSNADPLTLVEVTDGNGNAVAQTMHSETAASAPWAIEKHQSRTFPATLRDAIAADVDGDGLEEAVVVYLSGDEVRVYWADDAAQNHATNDQQIAFEQNVTNVSAIAGDFDADGVDELAIGLTQNGAGELLFARFSSTGVQTYGPRRTFSSNLSGATVDLELAAGNVDFDDALELALVFNEYGGTVFSPVGECRYVVFDDENASFSQLGAGSVTGRDGSNTLRTSVNANVAIGDIDGDNTGEVVFGGITEFARCGGGTSYFMLALDDAEHGLNTLDGHWFRYSHAKCNSGQDVRVQYVHVGAIDVDDDGLDEVVANSFVFEDWTNAAPWTEAYELPQDIIWEQNDFGHFAKNTSSFVFGDFDGDDREDIAAYRQDDRNVRIFGLGQLATTFDEVRTISVNGPPQSQDPVSPILLAVNVDTDSPVLKYDEGTYDLVFSEPVVIAALAAPPCVEGIGQNVDGCSTAFGNTTSTSTESERSVTISASATVGFSVDGGFLTQSEFSLKSRASVAATRMQSSAYTLSKTIIFTSGSTEDTVVFTCIPLDRWTYTVLSHPDPDMVGKDLIVSMPREPITLQVEREFYNRTVDDEAMRVDASVFQHVVGDIGSYPTSAQKNAIVNTRGGLEIGPQSVGQGAGSTEVTLEVGTEISKGKSLELGYEVELEATAGGAVAGFTVGASSTDSLRITSGKSTTYTGVVGAIDGANFAENRYLFGLFTYVHRDVQGREFEVLNYWVE